MTQNIKFNYHPKTYDYIEAEQLKSRNSVSSWTSLLYFLIFASLGAISLKRINHSDFLVFNYLRELSFSEEIPTNNLFDAIFNFMVALLLSGNSFPKYNPIYRWSLARKYQRNVIKQETKNIIIDDNKINIESNNYREVRKWQDFTQFKENKTIFLLYGSKNKTIIIPKRVFINSTEIEKFSTVLNSKIAEKV